MIFAIKRSLINAINAVNLAIYKYANLNGERNLQLIINTIDIWDSVG